MTRLRPSSICGMVSCSCFGRASKQEGGGTGRGGGGGQGVTGAGGVRGGAGY